MLPLKTLQLDVTDYASVNKAIQSIISESGRIDVLVKPSASTRRPVPRP